MGDYYHDGYGAGLSGCDWPATVLGRFLRPWQRRELFDGWRAGLRDVEAYRRDMAERHPDEARAREPEVEMSETIPW